MALRYDAFAGDNSRGDILKCDACRKDPVIPVVPVAPALAVKQEHAEETHAGEPDEAGLLDGERIRLSELSSAVELLVIQALENKGLSRTEIAKALGISRQALYKKMKKE